MSRAGFPRKQGLYDPVHEHDACGVGFVVDLKARKSHQLVMQAVEVLLNLEHRGACGCEVNTGDGAGLLLQTPHAFLSRVTDFDLPAFGGYGVGMIFLPRDAEGRRQCEALIERVIAEEGQTLLGWRDVPTDHSPIGPSARRGEPVVRQVFIGRAGKLPDDMAFERRLYVIRRRIENAVAAAKVPGGDLFYIPSLSYKTMVYKGMLKSDQLTAFYPDIVEKDFESAIGMVHSRFSTNTFPNWNRAHPYRYICHNGEINTLRGNINWMHAREKMFRSPLFGDDIGKIRPVIDAEGSDSAMFDNAMEMMALTGRTLAHAAMMMIPEPWSGHEAMSAAKRAFYEYHACLMEPWDGPALVAFTDGFRVGGVLDRNGLRPTRYYVTKDDLVIGSSEVGVLDVPPERVLRKGRLQPGRMFLIDLEQNRIIGDEELKEGMAAEKPYRSWLDSNLVDLEDLPAGGDIPRLEPDETRRLQHAFGYTTEDLKILIGPMASVGVEPLGSMGTDTPLAVLSDRPQLLYSYFKQLFAQVTNPPVDAIREELIMSTVTTIGSEQNLLEPGPLSARQIRLTTPILKNSELATLKALAGHRGFRAATLPILYRAADGVDGIRAAMEELCRKASEAIAAGHDILVLSDRGVDESMAAIPALLATAGLHHHLVREGTRTRAGIVVETGEAREVHHIALLIGYGAGAVNPYLVYETLAEMIRRGEFTDADYQKAVENYRKAALKGVVKVISKMGISTIQSYRGAQIFEAVGLGKSLVDAYFTWTASRIEGIDLEVVARETGERHRAAFAPRNRSNGQLDQGGQYQYRRGGEYHLFNPESIHRLQYATRTNNYDVFKQYSGLINNQSKRLCTLRGLMDLKFAEKPLPLEEVESAEAIMTRFKTGAMSYGSISKEAHEGLAIAMNRIGGKSNTGEGGEDPARYVPDANGDSRNSAIKQVASGRFGVTSNYLVHAQELQIKIAQGAKPGEGGQLPGRKVYPWIAKVRLSTPGVGLISPPPHHDIYSIEDLAELIYDLKNSNPRARVSVKLVAEVGVGTVAAGVAKAKSDVVLISGFDGGTGASPLTSIKHAGIPWELGLAETQQTLVLNDLRSRIRVEADGQMKTGRDVVIAALLGAEEFGFATAPLVVQGCILMRVCHLNTCPVGVATQDPRLRERYTGDPDHVVNFMRFIAEEVRELMAKLGFRTLNEMVGRTDRIEARKAVEHWKAKGLDYAQILHQPDAPPEVGRHASRDQDHGLEKTLDMTQLVPAAKAALGKGEKVEATFRIRNIDRTAAAILGSEVSRKYGAEGLPEDTIRFTFKGSAGQSFGAFVPRGMTLRLEGDANDYVGKGLSGGKLVVHPPKESTFVAEENIIIGNVAFYGATSGDAYIRGLAGERFCVRNSGVRAVVEGVGDHGCEYMTGGRVVVLGATGRNFAAGMSGGIAWVLDEKGDFRNHCNTAMASLHGLQDPEEIAELRGMIERHAELTGSAPAKRVLEDWDATLPKFVAVLPNDYKRVIDAQKRMRARGLPEEEAVMAAFELNVKDKSRVSGQ